MGMFTSSQNSFKYSKWLRSLYQPLPAYHWLCPFLKLIICQTEPSIIGQTSLLHLFLETDLTRTQTKVAVQRDSSATVCSATGFRKQDREWSSSLTGESSLHCRWMNLSLGQPMHCRWMNLNLVQPNIKAIDMWLRTCARLPHAE